MRVNADWLEDDQYRVLDNEPKNPLEEIMIHLELCMELRNVEVADSCSMTSTTPVSSHTSTSVERVVEMENIERSDSTIKLRKSSQDGWRNVVGLLILLEPIVHTGRTREL